MHLSARAEALVLAFEGCSLAPEWPGLRSGITIGHGYDLGYCSAERFLADWGARLDDAAVQRLLAVIGLSGIRARNRVAALAGIHVPAAAAAEVFRLRSVPRMLLDTQHAFPGVERLPADAGGALVSLVYNRGGSMIDRPGQDNRREMRVIRDLCAQPLPALQPIADALRSMKRLWEGKGMAGLLNRREAEAALVESCLPPPPP